MGVLAYHCFFVRSTASTQWKDLSTDLVWLALAAKRALTALPLKVG